MFRNARTYNEPGSPIYDASIVLQEAFIAKLHKVQPRYLSDLFSSSPLGCSSARSARSALRLATPRKTCSKN
jgi:hypothetical protein